MSIYDLKPRFQDLLRPLARKLVAWGITANQVTLFALLSSVFYGGMMLFDRAWWWWTCLPLFLFFRMALNALDGMMAREHGQQSKLGMILNELGDIIADVALFLPFVAVIGDIVLLFIFSAMMTEFSGVLAYMVYGTRTYHGPMGKSDRAFVVGTLSLLMAFLFLFKVKLVYTLLFFVFIILSFLCLITCYRRLKSP